MYHPHPLLKRAADDICLYISQKQDWSTLFEQGKMLGALLVDLPLPPPTNGRGNIHPIDEKHGLLVAYSGVVNGLKDPDGYFVPPVYDLSNPDAFYLQEDKEISDLNRQIEALQSRYIPDTFPKDCKSQIQVLKQQRKEKSLALQLKIFSHFDFVNQSGTYKNIVQIFADAKRGLPPGGSGECAAPRLLQRAYELNLTPIAMAEFWYGRSPKNYRRVHGQFYPSCIEKCSPILSYMLGKEDCDAPATSHKQPKIIFEDDHIILISKPEGVLSVPAKDLSLPSVESWLKERYPDCKLPFMLAHRLDQSTSGLLIAAKDAQTHKLLQQGFEQGTIHKRYLALLEGELPSSCGVISLPICPNPDDRPRQIVDWQFGKESVTRYHVLKREAGKTLIEFFPLTGRTHQLRLHAASPFGLDHPIVGDVLYFAQPKTRLMLHAETLKGWIGIPLEFHDPAGFE